MSPIPTLLAAHNVTVVGQGEEVVLWGHGFGTDQSVWKQFILDFVEAFLQLVLFDSVEVTTDTRNFCGLRYSLSGFVEVLPAVLGERLLESCVFIGHSVAGMVGCSASIERPELFPNIIMISSSPRYLNAAEYFCGLDLSHSFHATNLNFKACVSGFAPPAVGTVMDSMTVQEFSRTLFNIRPDIAFIVGKTTCQSNTRSVKSQVQVLCHILQIAKGLAATIFIASYLHKLLGGPSAMEFLPPGATGLSLIPPMPLSYP